MKKKFVGIVVFMLVATTVASATTINVNETNQTNTSHEMTSWSDTLVGYQPTPLNWGVDQKQTHTDGSGLTLYPPDINAQSFTPTKDKLTAVSLWLFKYASPPEPNLITISIRDNLTGPDLATKTINTSIVSISSKGTWVLFDFDDISVTPETAYYIICTGTAGDPGNAYCWLFSANDTYSRGDAWYKANVNYPWNINHAIGDFCFKTYFRKPLGGSSPTYNTMMQPIQPINTIILNNVNLTVENFKGGIGVSAVVKNVGNGTATNITWSIDLVGKMIFKGNHWTGSFESLAPGDTMKIKTGLILGFGKIYINATATCAEGATYSEEGQGILLLFLAIGVKEPLP
jgi:hypothetical protein